MPEFRNDGVRLHFELAGPDQGDPMVLVHGFASDYTLNWVGTRWQQTLVDAGHRVIGLDCRGHGASDKPHQPEAYERGVMAADVRALLDHLGVHRAAYLGYSMGSWIGLRMVLRHPERITRAVLGGIGSGRGFTSAEAVARRLRGDESERDPMALTFFEFASSRPENDLEALAACMEARQERLDEAELRCLEVPILIVTGDQDEIGAGASQLARQIPSARLLELPGRNHMNAVPARQFKEATLEFVRSR